MGATSAGLLLYRISPDGAVEVLIAHPGGPFWARKDDAAWSVPKGEYLAGRGSARRGLPGVRGGGWPRGSARARPSSSGSVASRAGSGSACGRWRATSTSTHSSSNTFELEWPRGSGRMQEFPEVDRVEWVSIDVARRKLREGPGPFPGCACWRPLRRRPTAPSRDPPRRLRTDRTSNRKSPAGVRSTLPERDIGVHVHCRHFANSHLAL